MHILLTNDDGIFSPALAALYAQLTTLGKVTVAAPSEVRSGAGHSISLTEITCEYVDIMGKFAGYSVDGSPADCVKLAINQLIDRKDKVDLVVSGMNYGANIGINVFYSGTVAGAIEGAFYNLPAIAVSAAMHNFLDPNESLDLNLAAAYAVGTIKQFDNLSPGSVVNINIPMLNKGAPKGIKVVPQSTSGFDEEFHSRNHNGQPVYRFVSCRHRDDRNGDWTDTTALEAGYITVTALRKELTDPMGNALFSAMGLSVPEIKK